MAVRLTKLSIVTTLKYAATPSPSCSALAQPDSVSSFNQVLNIMFPWLHMPALSIVQLQDHAGVLRWTYVLINSKLPRL